MDTAAILIHVCGVRTCVVCCINLLREWLSDEPQVFQCLRTNAIIDEMGYKMNYWTRFVPRESTVTSAAPQCFEVDAF